MFSLLQININLSIVSLAVYNITKLIDFLLFHFFHICESLRTNSYSNAINIFVSVDAYFHVFYVLEKLSVLLFAGFKSTTHKHNHSFSFLPKTP